MTYRKPDQAKINNEIDERWKLHVKEFPDHVRYHIVVPYGWRCCGGLDGKRCEANA